MTFFVGNRCEVYVCGKSFVFYNIIWIKFNIHPVCWDWYDFPIPVAFRWFITRLGTTIRSSQICYQFLIFIRIYLLYSNGITIRIRKELIKRKIYLGCVAILWHFEFYILNCQHFEMSTFWNVKFFLNGFLYELGNFKQ